MEEISFQEYATTKQGPKFPKKLFLMLLFLLVLAGIGLVGYGALHSSEGAKPEITPTATPTPTSIPSETPTPTIDPSISPVKGKTTPTPTGTSTSGSSVDKTTGLDRAKLTVKVLNGSGTSGAAKAIADTLTKAGYTVSSTGNADTFDYTDITIQVKNTSSKYLPLLKKDLSVDYTVGSSSSSLSSATGTDAVVIVGKE